MPVKVGIPKGEREKKQTNDVEIETWNWNVKLTQKHLYRNVILWQQFHEGLYHLDFTKKWNEIAFLLCK